MSGIRRAALVLAGAALLVAGCAGGGGDDDEPADIPATMTEMSGMPREMLDDDDMPTSTPPPE